MAKPLILLFSVPIAAGLLLVQISFPTSRITPFESYPVQGLVDATYVNGVPVFTRD